VEQRVQPDRPLRRCRVHQPAPDDPGGDERDRHREQVDRAEAALAADALVQQQRQQPAEHQRAGHEDDGEQQGVLDRQVPPLLAPQPGEVPQADEARRRDVGGLAAQRQPDVPADEPVHEDADRDDRRGEQE
jgi:hypothetical protein